MIRIATCFSGIGAIEHALYRMKLDHQIVFACDNGDVDILSKKIDLDISCISAELDFLSNIVKRFPEGELKTELLEDLNRNLVLFDEVLYKLESVPVEFKEIVLSTLKSILCTSDLKKVRFKEYTAFYEKLSSQKNHNINLYTLSYAIEIANDFHKDNSWESLLKNDVKYSSSDNIRWEAVISNVRCIYELIDKINGRKLIKSVNDICERLGMLHEKIRVNEIHKDLAELQGYDEKKYYVDELYKRFENRNQVKKSYLANYDLAERNFHWNVSFLDGNEYSDKVDLFVGGSPCQSFSLVGKQRGLEDTRGTLFYDYARLIKEIRPKVFIYENVKALLSNDEGKTWQTMSQVFTDLDYNWQYAVLNAKDYGVPQNRERIFVVGFRKDLILDKEFHFPKPIKLTAKMQDYLVSDPEDKYYLPPKGINFVTNEKNLNKKYTQINGDIALCQKKNQQFNWHGDFVSVKDSLDISKEEQNLEKYYLSDKVKEYVLKTGTKNFYSKPKTDLEVARPLLNTMHKMHRAGVDNYVTTNGRLRKLTPRECLRLMGFCDNFKIVVSDTSMYQQSGNSIVVDVLMHIMKEILNAYPQLADLNGD